MAGLYLHIPFCKRKCHYCNFYSLASSKYKAELVEAMTKEIALQKGYLENEILESIYFGGGTPSLLDGDELNSIFNQIKTSFSLSDKIEITFEANPDDLNASYLKKLSQTPINRLSIGVQSFNDQELTYLNRLHSAKDATEVIKRAQDIGFSSISLDLIYGIPIATDESWLKNLEHFKSLEIDHLSAYNLTREPNTAYDVLIKKGKYMPPDDAQGEQHFKLLLNFAHENNLEQYEISNFAFDNKYAVHNTNYWLQKKYLGIGPSAHSFNIISRHWNVSNLKQYITALNNSKPFYDSETLNKNDQWNEIIMTGLRTKWGVDINLLKETFKAEWVDNLNKQVQKHLSNKLLLQTESHYLLSEKGLFFADGIASSLFRIDEL